MKKALYLFLIVIICFTLVSCEDSESHLGQAKTPSGSSVMKGRTYTDVVEIFEEKGFKNIRLEKLEDLIFGWLTKDGEVEKVTVGGEENYSADKWVDSNTEIVIYYHTFPSDDEQEETLSDQTSNKEEDCSNETDTLQTLTVENCPELKSLLQLRDPLDYSVKEFANKYAGQVIEFDGCILAMDYHEDYNTRYDILIGAGDFSETSANGPNFKLTNVNYYDMGLDTLWVEDVLSVGTNICVVAKVGKYDSNTGLFELKIIQVMMRDK